MFKYFIFIVFLFTLSFSHEWAFDESYSEGDVVVYSNILYKAKTSVPLNNPPPSVTFWSYIGSYSVSPLDYIERLTFRADSSLKIWVNLVADPYYLRPDMFGDSAISIQTDMILSSFSVNSNMRLGSFWDDSTNSWGVWVVYLK